jgi:hypothetical protein
MTWSHVSWPLAGPLAAASLIAACAGTPDPCGHAATCVVVHVDSVQIHSIDQLALDLVYNGVHATAVTGAAGEPRSLPTMTAVILELSNNLLVQFNLLVAGELGGSVIAGGATSTTVVPGSHDAVSIDLSPVDPCTEGALYCGGFGAILADDHALYRCSGGLLQFYARCMNGCTALLETDAMCVGVGACTEGGTYCGGNEVDGDPGTLYVCHDLAGTAPIHCPTACVVNGGGHDFCR